MSSDNLLRNGMASSSSHTCYAAVHPFNMAQLEQALDTFKGNTELAVECILATDPTQGAASEDSRRNTPGVRYVKPESGSGAVASTSAALRSAQEVLLFGTSDRMDRSLYYSTYTDTGTFQSQDRQSRRHDQSKIMQELLPLIKNAEDSVQEQEGMNLVLWATSTQEIVTRPPQIDLESEPVPMKVDQEAIDQMKTQILPFVLQRIKAIQMPPLNSQVDSFLGHLQLAAAELAIDVSYTDGASYVDVSVSRDGMSIEVMNLSAGVQDVKWGWDQVAFPHMSGKGAFTAKATGVDIKFLLCTDMDMREVAAAGAPGGIVEPSSLWSSKTFKLKIVPQIVTIEKLEMEVTEATGSWVYNAGLSIMEAEIQRSLEEGISNALQDSAHMLTESLEWLPVVAYAIQQAEMLEDERGARR